MTDGWSELAEELRDAGASVDQYLLELRQRGASIVDCLKAVRAVEGVGLGEAKTLVDESPTWADARASNAALRADIIAAMEDDPGWSPAP